MFFDFIAYPHEDKTKGINDYLILIDSQSF